MSPPVQHASIAAWCDEAHVRENRALYREKFETVVPMLAGSLEAPMPEAAFYLTKTLAGNWHSTADPFIQTPPEPDFSSSSTHDVQISSHSTLPRRLDVDPRAVAVTLQHV